MPYEDRLILQEVSWHIPQTLADLGDRLGQHLSNPGPPVSWALGSLSLHRYRSKAESRAKI
jgi:hypothetical protein